MVGKLAKLLSLLKLSWRSPLKLQLFKGGLSFVKKEVVLEGHPSILFLLAHSLQLLKEPLLAKKEGNVTLSFLFEALRWGFSCSILCLIHVVHVYEEAFQSKPWGGLRLTLMKGFWLLFHSYAMYVASMLWRVVCVVLIVLFMRVTCLFNFMGMVLKEVKLLQKKLPLSHIFQCMQVLWIWS